ncbi:hypothetical protein [Caulobacter soli]|uniref:hypothetical protein n=1 Tax=Caulobacter soli TaxID=2708539 RepID=UPI0013EDB1A8|nr:hypothetical protein [Caulobacter soli]
MTQAAEPALPKLNVQLTPHAEGGAQSYMAVRETLEAPSLPAGGVLVRLPVKLVGIPGSQLLGDGLTARDASGPLSLTEELEPPTPQGGYRHWKVSRATVGDVVVDYRAAPRQISAATNNGPLFDLREESGGFAGAGVTFLAVPPGERPYRLAVDWDLSQAPKGSRGVSSLGEGHVETVGPAERLVFSFYAAGPLQTLPGQSDGFGLYWLSPPPFPADTLGARIKTLHAAMAKFFGTSDSAYRVFIRQNPYAGTGGTALPSSFMFGYRASDKPTLEALQSLVSHEMAHNWPAMQGEHGDTAWYSEGTAEFYSMLLSYRSGLLSLDGFVDSLNDKTAAYYTNPYLRLTNPEAAKIFWSDPTAQTVPYGRGFLYLVDTDAAIRAKSGGKHSLDDVVQEIYRRQKADQPYAIETWLDLVGKEIGADAAKAGYQAMANGEVLHPANRFAGCLVASPKTMRIFELGFDRASLADARIVRGLKAGSEADKAGVRDGDQILTESGLLEARKDETRALTLTLKRDGAERTVTFQPRGAGVEGVVWAKGPGANPETCRF